MLTGGATAICGASAALALSAALPSHPQKEKATLFTVIGVSALSTLAMIVYPMIARWLELTPQHAGIFLGATIHDVAQVVGAGYSMSTEAGDTATVVKLMRVAMLLPVIICAAMITRRQGSPSTGKRPPLLPWFAVGFLILACINSTGWVPTLVQGGINELSRVVFDYFDQCFRDENTIKRVSNSRYKTDTADDWRKYFSGIVGIKPDALVVLIGHSLNKSFARRNKKIC